MNRSFSHIPKYYQRYVIVFAAMILLLFTSCPVKNGLKILAGVPVNNEQGVPKKGHLLSVNEAEKCVNIESSNAKIAQSISFSADDLLPAIIFAATFLLLFGFTLRNQQSHPDYGNLKIPGSLPIYLQHRKLLI